MGRTLTEILWQLERKRKYCWSYGTNRTTPSIIAKLVTFALCLVLLYLFLVSLLGNFSSDLDIFNEINAAAADKEFVQGDYFNFTVDRNSIRRSILGTSNLEKNAKERLERMKSIFLETDQDGNGYLDEAEITRRILDGVKAYFTFAVKDNFNKYFEIDSSPRNGLVTWDEYINYFFKTLKIHGVTPEDVHTKSTVFKALPRNVKEEIAGIQASWSEAAGNSPDFLTVDEFLGFEHPEASPTKILAQVQDVFSTFDLDGDGVITNGEFETTYQEAEDVDSVYKNDKHLIDTDGNGQISRVELMRYMDPRNIHHSKKEAKKLLRIADSNGNGKLSLSEVMNKTDLISTSKFYDIEKSLNFID